MPNVGPNVLYDPKQGSGPLYASSSAGWGGDHCWGVLWGSCTTKKQIFGNCSSNEEVVVTKPGNVSPSGLG